MRVTSSFLILPKSTQSHKTIFGKNWKRGYDGMYFDLFFEEKGGPQIGYSYK